MTNTRILDLPVESIHLDRENPRLPESLRGKEESTILEHLWTHDVLHELVTSMLSNGFFSQEPLLVDKTENGRYVVLEGNRRLGALKVIHGAEIAADIPELDPLPTPEQRERLTRIPCVIVGGRDEVRKYLGFRHISGLRRWAPEARARYVRDEVMRCLQDNQEDPRPFLTVAERVGSNLQGIRNSFLAISILLHGREELGLGTAEVQQKRFGVWLRCMNSPEIREHIGIGLPKTYEEVMEALPKIRKSGLREVIGDLVSGGMGRPVLDDSRHVTLYGKVLGDERARSTLRKTRDLSIAIEVVNQAALPDRIRKLASTAGVIIEQLEDAAASKELLAAAQELFGKARTIRAIAKDKLEPDDD